MRPIALATITALSVSTPAAAAAVESVPHPDAAPETLALSCKGFVTRENVAHVGGGIFVPGQPVPVATNIVTESQHAARVLIDISGIVGRIKIPSAFVPVIHSHSDDGWRPLDSLEMGNAGIHGRFRLNSLNKPNVIIDRMTGHIDISGGLGTFNFSGDCEKYDPNAAPVPKF